MSFGTIEQLLAIMIRLAAPTILVTLGGIFSVKIKIFPIGLEAFMLAGSFSAVWVTYMTHDPYLACLVAGLSVMLLSLVFALFVFEFGVNSVICGFSLYTIVHGLSRYILSALYDMNGTMRLEEADALPKLSIPILRDIPFVNTLLDNHSILVYVALIMPFLVHFLLYKTNYGLELRATGANPEATVMMGIKSKRDRYIALALGGFLCGLGGAQLAMASNLYTVGMTDGRGYTAVAALVLTNAEPILSFLVCLLYGLTEGLVIQLSGEGHNPQFLATLPYFVAIAAAIVPPIIRNIRNKIDDRNFKNQIAKYRKQNSIPKEESF